MRRSLTVLGVAALLVAAARPAASATNPTPRPAPPAHASAACGADAPNGVVLYRAYDGHGQAVDPPLALVDPTNTIRRPVVVPDPRDFIPTRSGCRAVVRSATGGAFLVDGASGEARRLALGDPADDLRYHPEVGGRRWGLFAPGTSYGSWHTAVLVDFATGAVTDLATLIPNVGYVLSARFSPSGVNLVVDAAENEVAPTRPWLVPMDHPARARTVGDSYSLFLSFDETGRRLLYWTFRRDEPERTQELVVEDVSDGTTTVVATEPMPDGEEPYLGGSFLPGRDDLAVRYADRFVLLDVSGTAPVERFVLDGAFGWFLAAASGTRGILAGDVPGPIADGVNPPVSVDPPLTFVDLEGQTAQPITGESGEPVRLAGEGGTPGRPGRWYLLAVGGDGSLPTALASFDIETGKMAPLLSLVDENLEPAATRLSADGRVMLVVSSIPGSRQRLRLLEAALGTVIDLAEAGGVIGALSPDGRWAAFSTLDRTDGGRTMTLAVADTASGDIVPVGPGLDPTWLAP